MALLPWFNSNFRYPFDRAKIEKGTLAHASRQKAAGHIKVRLQIEINFTRIERIGGSCGEHPPHALLR
jgi:hypothetical protein